MACATALAVITAPGCGSVQPCCARCAVAPVCRRRGGAHERDPAADVDSLRVVQAHAEIEAGAGDLIAQGNRIAEQHHAAERHVGLVLAEETFELCL